MRAFRKCFTFSSQPETEDGHMVEHVRYPERGIEMRRIFRKGC